MTWTKQISIRSFGTVPEMRHVFVALAASSSGASCVLPCLASADRAMQR